VERAAAAAGGWDSVGRIAVGLGPGSFTGLRIGIATARGLRAALGLPVVGVCSLDGLARGITAEAAAGRDRLAVLDARRGEVFAALYSPGGERILGPLVATASELAEQLRRRPEPPVAAGSGALAFRAELAGAGVEVLDHSDPANRVSALDICALGAEAAAAAAGSLDPIYLRPPDAERWRERDTAKGTGD
jgi:tRNA threonylcarbamoyladenosine biosynthesis protein TsaB